MELNFLCLLLLSAIVFCYIIYICILTIKPVRRHLLLITIWPIMSLCILTIKPVRRHLILITLWPIMSLCLVDVWERFSLVLWSSLRFPCKTDVRFVITPICSIGGTWYISVFFVFIYVDGSNTTSVSDDVRIVEQ